MLTKFLSESKAQDFPEISVVPTTFICVFQNRIVSNETAILSPHLCGNLCPRTLPYRSIKSFLFLARDHIVVRNFEKKILHITLVSLLFKHANYKNKFFAKDITRSRKHSKNDKSTFFLYPVTDGGTRNT